MKKYGILEEIVREKTLTVTTYIKKLDTVDLHLPCL
jgi:hypothetical protein